MTATEIARSVLAAPARIGREKWVAGAVGAVVMAAAVLAPVPVAAALVTGFFNTAGGGGAVVTFLALTATGVPALTAHATSQLVTPVSFLGGFRLARRYRPGWRPLVAGCVGTVAGVGILTITPPNTFQAIAPWCLLPAAAMVLAQDPVRRLVQRTGRTLGERTTLAATFVCGVYAGLIGVGTGTLALAVLGLAPGFVGMPLRDLLRTRNVLLLGMAVLVSAAFAVTGLVDWTLVAVLAAPAAAGGWLGTKLVGRLPVPVLQALIVTTALAGAAWLL
ncbi:sulfite exporter TauE/SafE family protein, partial [Actinophytocola sp.]|uniref:sulfite exporter TauE/SafE family protein n=1 Tax=Actinophytocola sp. TaxID=1872138 RepID=UPI002ED9362D